MSFNKLLNKLNVELHLPGGYRYCGPGTKLAERLSRGDLPINELDRACLAHDISYSKHRDNLKVRHEADSVLEKEALKRVLSKDSGIGEKLAAFGVSAIMKLKRKLGAGVLGKKTRGRKKTVRRKRGGALRSVVKKKTKKGRRKMRVIPVPSKIGGAVPLIPLFAGLGALASVAKVVNDVNSAKGQLAETARHNKYMEGIAAGKGFRLQPWGYGMQFAKTKRKATKKKKPRSTSTFTKACFKQY